MIDHVWTVVCLNATVDTESGNLNLQNVLEQLTVWEQPSPDLVLPVRLHVVTMWVRSDLDVPSQGRGRLSLFSPSGRIGSLVEFMIDLSESTRARGRITIDGLHVPEVGRYSFRVEFQNEGVAPWLQTPAVPLEVVFEPQEARPVAVAVDPEQSIRE